MNVDASRPLPALFVIALWTLVALASAEAEEKAGPPGWRDAVGQLAREKMLAESCAVLLRDYARDERIVLLRGQKLYEEGRVEAEVLIEQLLVDLAEGRRPDEAPDLAARLEAVPERRQGFCAYVDQAIGDEIEPGTRNILIDALIEGAAELVGSLLDAGLAIWQEYRRADEVRRATIASRIEAQRWRPFHEVEIGT